MLRGFLKLFLFGLFACVQASKLDDCNFYHKKFDCDLVENKDGALKADDFETCENKKNENKIKKNISYVFVHGTVASSAYLFPNIFENFRKSFVYKTFMMLPGEGFFKFNLKNEELDLFDSSLSIDKNDDSLLAPTLPKFISCFKDIVDDFSKVKKDFENLNFYVFGWKGGLSNQSRWQGAKDLYKSILSLEQSLGSDLENIVRFVAHSHGGNVCLNLAAVHQERKNKKLPLISKNTKIEIYMFGAPILEETESFAGDDLFDFVVNFYSDGDLVQRSDIFSAKKKSRQKFNMDLFNLKQQKKIAQVKAVYCVDSELLGEVKVNPGHASLFIPSYPLVKYPIALTLPFVLDAKDSSGEFFGDMNLNACVCFNKNDVYCCNLYKNDKIINSCNKTFSSILPMNQYFTKKKLSCLKRIPLGFQTITRLLFEKKLSN